MSSLEPQPQRHCRQLYTMATHRLQLPRLHHRQLLLRLYVVTQMLPADTNGTHPLRYQDPLVISHNFHPILPHLEV